MYTMRLGSAPHISHRDDTGWDDSGRHLKKVLHNYTRAWDEMVGRAPLPPTSNRLVSSQNAKG